MAAVAVLARWSAVLAAVLVGLGPASAFAEPAVQTVRFGQGERAVELAGTLKGYDGVDYRLDGRRGERIAVRLAADSRMAYFNVLPPGSEEAVFIGSTLGSEFTGTLDRDGEWTLRVYLMRAGARRGESSDFTLTVERLDQPVATGAFEQTLNLHGIGFHVTSPNLIDGNQVTIQPSGLTIDNSAITRPVEGLVTGADVADLDVDGAPEIYVYVRKSGVRAGMSLVALASNRNKSLSDIHLPGIDSAPEASIGYVGGDEIAVVESVLARRFPIGDSGRMRQLQYRLVPGEAGWLLQLDQVVEF